MSVEFKGKEYRIKKKGGLLTLNLSWKEIMNISEIQGLESLNELQVLNLSRNSIFEIEGLESLKNLLELHLDSNRIVKIKGLEALKDLKLLNLAANSISEIEGLDTLTNLEELHLESNKIEIIKGLDTLESLHTLRLDGNMVAKVESFQNKEKLTHFFFDKNPLYDRLKRLFGSANPQNLEEFIQMSNKEIEEEEKRLTETDKNPLFDRLKHVSNFRSTNPQNLKKFIQMPSKEIEEEKRITEAAQYKPSIQKQTYKKSLLLCNTCGHSESLKDGELAECPMCQSVKIELIPFSKSRGRDIAEILKVFFGIIGGILLISGFILSFFDLGLSRPVVNILGFSFYLDPLGITFLVLGAVLLSVAFGEVFCCCD